MVHRPPVQGGPFPGAGKKCARSILVNAPVIAVVRVNVGLKAINTFPH
jgi:hypothetical protein